MGLFFIVFFSFFFSHSVESAPPLVLPLNPSYQDQYGLFGGLSLTWDDDLLLDSMTASASMNVLKKTEAAMKNLRRLTDPLVCAKLSAPAGMQRNLLLTLYWLAEADMAGASVEQVLQEISRRGRDQPPPQTPPWLKSSSLTTTPLATSVFSASPASSNLAKASPPPSPNRTTIPTTASPSPFPSSPPTAFPKSPTNC